MGEQKEKTYVISCSITPAVNYKWNRQINRDGGKAGNRTENNNALIKCPPVFLRDIQAKDGTLFSDRRIKMCVCEKVGIPFKEEYMHYGFTALTAETKADTSDPVAVGIDEAYKNGKTKEEIAASMKKQKFTPAQIAKYLPETKKVPAKTGFSFE